MHRVAVLNVVGLSEGLLGPAAPRLEAFWKAGEKAIIKPALPAVTCTAQANYLTGAFPTHHGIVGNGWYHRELAEVQFWKQSNHLVRGPKVWERLRAAQSGFTCAQLFWWFNMYAAVDYSITPRPMYPSDGRKVFDIHSWPYDIRPRIKADLGEFPFLTFWGPAAGKSSPLGGPDAATRWIAESAKWIERHYQPTLNLVYLPHLDYNLQRLGPGHHAVAEDVAAVDRIVGELLDFFRARDVEPVVISEYGITPVSKPIHLNRLFREQGWLAIKEELGREMLDCGASRVFAVADHQAAHVYINDPSLGPTVASLLASQPGIAQVLDEGGKTAAGLAHARAGDLVVFAAEDAWFTYYYWQDDGAAPDFARCVDIHRKLGYDPVELFLDPDLVWARGKILWRKLQQRLGFRTLMDVIPLKAELVKGSHGVCPKDRQHWPVAITGRKGVLAKDTLSSTAVQGLILGLVQ